MLHSFLHVLSPDYIQTQYILFLKVPSLADSLLGRYGSEKQRGKSSPLKMQMCKYHDVPMMMGLWCAKWFMLDFVDMWYCVDWEK